MTIIQQPTLFDMQILEQLDIEDKYFEIFSPLDFTPLIGLFQKDKSVGWCTHFCELRSRHSLIGRIFS